jgi:molybdopterin-guanine dinucleotide biosynthesis protein A
VRPVVAVLAGGQGRRLGEPKPLADLGGRPLIAWPLAAARAAGLEAVVVAKPSTPLPALDVPLWTEPDEPQHPLAGLVRALEEGRPVVAVGCDMPYVTREALSALAAASGTAVFGDQPFPGRYEPGSLDALRAALARSAPVREALAALDPERLPLTDVRVTTSINTPQQLAAARRELAG